MNQITPEQVRGEKAYPPGWGTYTVSMYKEDYLEDAGYMLESINDAFKRYGVDIRFVAIESSEEFNHVRFSILIDGEEH